MSRYKDGAVKMEPVELLKGHRLNMDIYSEHIDDAFVESIKELGVLVPLIVVQSENDKLNNRVVTGRRRLMASKKLGLTEVPVRRWVCDDPLEIEERLITDNVRNETTKEERVKMFAHLKRIEEARAEIRRKAGAKVDEKGRSDERAAAAVGMSATTANTAEAVVVTIDSLKSAGKTEEAAKLSETLNTKSVAAAAKAAAKAAKEAGVAPAKTPKPKAAKVYPHSADIKRCIGGMTSALRRLETMRAEFMNIVDLKKSEKSEEMFSGSARKFERSSREIAKAIEPIENTLGVIEAAWTAYTEKNEPKE